MTTPSPSPNNKSLAALNSGAIKISREPQPIQPSLNPQYPSLADLNSFTPKSAPRNTYPTTIKQTFNPFTPNIPDRSTKPETSVNSKVLPDIDVSKDDFNEAKQSFDIDRSDSNSSIRYKYWISRWFFINSLLQE